MPDHDIRCTVHAVDRDQTRCQQVGDHFLIGRRTPTGMCCRAFAAVYPSAVALRFSSACAWQDDGAHIDVHCPDGHVVYRLTRRPATAERSDGI